MWVSPKGLKTWSKCEYFCTGTFHEHVCVSLYMYQNECIHMHIKHIIYIYYIQISHIHASYQKSILCMHTSWDMYVHAYRQSDSTRTTLSARRKRRSWWRIFWRRAELRGCKNRRIGEEIQRLTWCIYACISRHAGQRDDRRRRADGHHYVRVPVTDVSVIRVLSLSLCMETP